MSKLPPLNNLPSWSRSSLERRKVQRSITKDPVSPLNKIQENIPMPNRSGSAVKLSISAKSSSSSRIVSAPTSAKVQEKIKTRREAQLENSILFLQEQHQETLSKLQDEIEKLKNENKELNFKLIVTNEGASPPSAKQRTSGSYYRSKIRRLENEVKNIKLSLIEAQKHNVDLSKRLSERELSGKRYKTLPPVPSHTSFKLNNSQSPNGQSDKNFTPTTAEQLSSRESTRDQNINHLNLFSPGKTTVLQVTFGKKGDIYVQPSTGAGSRSPTMSECKDIIHYLEDTNKRQGQELTRLKEEMEGNDSAKYSPDTYLVTKTLNGRTTHYDQKSVILPALRPAGSGNVADRRRGQQAVLRGRGKPRDVNY